MCREPGTATIMKFMIGMDCEGAAGVVGFPRSTLCASMDLEFARKQATREADAAARALFDSGADQVIVWDNHGSGTNLVFDLLDSRCTIAHGLGFARRFPGLDESFAGVLMVGYHAMQGTPMGVLAHTYSPGTYRTIRVNQKAVGEIALDAAVAGESGVPMIFLSSDQQGCREGRSFMPWIETVATKQGFGQHCAVSMHPQYSPDIIYAGVQKAVQRSLDMKPFTFKKPVKMEIEFKNRLAMLKFLVRRKGWKLASTRKIIKVVPSMLEWQC